jgi:hypothetical protein
MRLPHWRFLHAAAVVVAASASLFSFADGAWSQAARTIRIVVAVPAGGPADILTHLFAEQMSQAFSRARGPMLQIDTACWRTEQSVPRMYRTPHPTGTPC